MAVFNSDIAGREAFLQEDKSVLLSFLNTKVREGASDLEIAHILSKVKIDLQNIMKYVNVSDERRELLMAIGLIESQIDFALQNTFPLREGDAPLPSHHEILSSVVKCFTPENVKEILKFRKAQLVIAPITSTERYINEMLPMRLDGGFVFGVFLATNVRSYLANLQNDERIENDLIKRWRFAVAEGVQDLEPDDWDDPKLDVDVRLVMFKNRFSASTLERLDIVSYIVLAYQSMKQKKPIDTGFKLKYFENGEISGRTVFKTLLNDDSTLIALGRISDNLVIEGECVSESDDGCLFRPALIGDISH